MSALPDISGFVAASRRQRQTMGTECVFHLPSDPVWPLGTRINPDTGEPYDAMLTPTNPPFTDVTKRVLIILKQGSPLRPQADTHTEPAGLMSGMDIILDVDSADHSAVKDASEFTVQELTYRVEEWKPFSIGDVNYRFLLYGAER